MSVPDRLDDAPEPADLRPLFRRHAAGVAVVTAGSAAGPVGFTATSLASVSAQPPLISFNIGRGSSSWPALQVASHVGVHVLGAHDAELATRFATSGADRFAAPTRWRPGPFGVPVLDGVVGWAVAEIEQRVDAGDHVIVVAAVVTAHLGPGSAHPLVHHDGRYLPRPSGGGWNRRG